MQKEKEIKSRLKYTPPTFQVLILSEQEKLLAVSPPQVKPGVSVVPPEDEDGEELTGAKKWEFWNEEEFN